MTEFKSTILQVVQRLASTTRALQEQTLTTQFKADKSEVTQVDLFVQAVISRHLTQRTPHIPILGEESVAPLLTAHSLMKSVESLLRQNGISENPLTLLGLATHNPQAQEYWCLDPIDGTRGFLRGDQYAIALARIKAGIVVESYLACPRLRNHGVVFVHRERAIRAWSLDTAMPMEISATHRSKDPVIIESLELSRATSDFTTRLRRELKWNTDNVKMDSQAKYGALALGDAHCYVRLPRFPGHKEFAWDHAAGANLVEAAGGTVTDLNGRALDFSCGAKLHNNTGILATFGVDHGSILEAIKMLETSQL